MQAGRIACVTLEMGCGGAQNVMQVLTKNLVELGYPVSLILADGGTPDFYPVDPRVHRTAPLAPDRENFHALDMLGRCKRLSRLRKLILQTKPDVVISFEDFLSVEVILSLFGSKVPIIVCEHNDPRFHTIPLRWRILRRLFYPRAKAVVVLNNSICDWSRRLVLPWPSVCIPNPLEVASDILHPPPAWINSSTIVALGRLVHQKGFDLAIEAFAKIADQNPSWNLSIMGEGPERDQLQRQISSHRLEARIKLVGRVSSPRTILPHGGIFILPSRYEGFGISLIEAMDAGLPIVSYDCPSSPSEILTRDVDGILVPPNDVNALAGALHTLMINPDLRKRLSLAAKESVLKYRPESIMLQWENLIEGVLS